MNIKIFIFGVTVVLCVSQQVYLAGPFPGGGGGALAK